MKAPKNTFELMNLLTSMEHRERFVFPVTKELKAQFRDLEAIEVYATTLFEVKGQPTNINLKAVTIDGKLAEHKIDGSTLNKSKYLRLFTPHYYDSILSIIDGTYKSDSQQIEQKTLRIA